MITVHHLETSRSQRVLWLLEELGVAYEIKRYQRNPLTRLAPPELRATTTAVIAFALLYKFGDAIAGAMANPFYVELGFSGVEIASVTKVFGIAANLAGVIAGGVFVARSGVFRALMIGGVLQAATNLLFALQAPSHGSAAIRATEAAGAPTR